MTNHLYYGDNLYVLREHIADESVDLIYLDPPFNSQANYNVLFRSPKGEQSQAQIEAFEDTWSWNDSAERAFDEVMQSGNTDAAEMLRAMRRKATLPPPLEESSAVFIGESAPTIHDAENLAGAEGLADRLVSLGTPACRLKPPHQGGWFRCGFKVQGRPSHFRIHGWDSVSSRPSLRRDRFAPESRRRSTKATRTSVRRIRASRDCGGGSSR